LNNIFTCNSDNIYENFTNICDKNNSNTIDYIDNIHDETDIINNIECVNEEVNLEDISVSTNFESDINHNTDGK